MRSGRRTRGSRPTRKPLGIYCGNNELFGDIVSGARAWGTPYACMRKGVGVGLNLPRDREYRNYRPRAKRKVYCGTRALPDGYACVGNLPQCLQKGVAIGKRQRWVRR